MRAAPGDGTGEEKGERPEVTSEVRSPQKLQATQNRQDGGMVGWEGAKNVGLVDWVDVLSASSLPQQK